MKSKYILYLFVLIGLTACETDDEGNVIPPVELTAGSANLSNFVAIGNSLTAGYTDNALFIAGQQNSMPKLAAEKFALVGGGTFNQPLTNDNIGGLTLSGNVIAPPRLYFDGSGPALLPAMPTTEVSNILSGPFNNLGVPGAKSFHLLANGYGNIANLQFGLANPYYVRMASSPNASVIEDAVAQAPTFFSLWIGNNDVLGYATSGGDGSNPITDQATFSGAFSAIMAALSSTGAQGVIANIPDVTTIPYFTTVPHNPLDPGNPAFGPQIPLLNTIYGALNDVYAFLGVTGRDVVFSETQASPVVIRDESLTDLSAQITAVLNANPAFPAFVAQFGLPPQAAPLVANLLGLTYGQSRQATPNDLLVLPSSTVIGTVNTDNAAFLQSQGLPPALAAQFSAEGVSLPLGDRWVLLPTEQMEVAMATESFNSIIASAAQSGGYGLIDANDILSKMATEGYTSGDFTFTADLVLGGFFSLDGVHPNSRGFAMMANELLKAVDATYGSTFEASGNLINPGDYPTNYSPLLN